MCSAGVGGTETNSVRVGWLDEAGEAAASLRWDHGMASWQAIPIASMVFPSGGQLAPISGQRGLTEWKLPIAQPRVCTHSSELRPMHAMHRFVLLYMTGKVVSRYIHTGTRGGGRDKGGPVRIDYGRVGRSMECSNAMILYKSRASCSPSHAQSS